MSIYTAAMGDSFQRLHPMLQKRYSFSPDFPFRASGTMHVIKGGARWMNPFFKLGTRWKLLFPERGNNIPFTILNEASIYPQQHVYWKRAFSFPTGVRYFNATMSFDEKRGIVKDYLGEPPLLYSDLTFTATEDGALFIHSLNQRLVLGKIELPLPKAFQGIATVYEAFNEEKRVFEISVNVRNPLLGTIFSYEGEFVTYDDATIC